MIKTDKYQARMNICALEIFMPEYCRAVAVSIPAEMYRD